MDALLIVDMQVGLLSGEPKHDLPGVIDRINRLAANVRAQSGLVIFIQHCGDVGDAFDDTGAGAIDQHDLAYQAGRSTRHQRRQRCDGGLLDPFGRNDDAQHE